MASLSSVTFFFLFVVLQPPSPGTLHPAYVSSAQLSASSATNNNLGSRLHIVTWVYVQTLLSQVYILILHFKSYVILLVSIFACSRCSATGLNTQIVSGGSKPPRSVDRTVNAGRITTAAQRNPPRTLRIQEPRSSLG